MSGVIISKKHGIIKTTSPDMYSDFFGHCDISEISGQKNASVHQIEKGNDDIENLICATESEFKKYNREWFKRDLYKIHLNKIKERKPYYTIKSDYTKYL